MSRAASCPDELGPWLVEQRRRKRPWKVLQAETGLGRTWLWTLWRQALEGQPPRKDVQ